MRGKAKKKKTSPKLGEREREKKSSGGKEILTDRLTTSLGRRRTHERESPFGFIPDKQTTTSFSSSTSYLLTRQLALLVLRKVLCSFGYFQNGDQKEKREREMTDSQSVS